MIIIYIFEEIPHYSIHWSEQAVEHWERGGGGGCRRLLRLRQSAECNTWSQRSWYQPVQICHLHHLWRCEVRDNKQGESHARRRVRGRLWKFFTTHLSMASLLACPLAWTTVPLSVPLLSSQNLSDRWIMKHHSQHLYEGGFQKAGSAKSM